MKKYEILGGNLPVVVCELAAGESMITESGSMSWMSPNMKMETVSGGGMKKMFGRMMSGESAFQNRYTAEGTDGMIAFASSFPVLIFVKSPIFNFIMHPLNPHLDFLSQYKFYANSNFSIY